jgi:hypothetical protein
VFAFSAPSVATTGWPEQSEFELSVRFWNFLTSGSRSVSNILEVRERKCAAAAVQTLQDSSRQLSSLVSDQLD